MSTLRTTVLTAAGVALCALLAAETRAWQGAPKDGAGARPKLGYTDTPMQPYGTYRVHDGTRPQPRVVTPGTASTQDAPGKAPSDAVVLFDGSDLSKWQGGR